MPDILVNFPPDRVHLLIDRLLALGYSQTRLARETGVPQCTISRLLSGEGVPTATNYYKLVVFAAAKLERK